MGLTKSKNLVKFSPEGKGIMIKIAAAILFACLLFQPAVLLAAEDNDKKWTPLQKTLLLAYVTGSAVDTAQTWYALKYRNVEEGNPIFGPHPKLSEIMGVKLVALGTIFVLAHKLLHGDYRTMALGAVNVIQWGVIGWNEASSGGIILQW